MQMRKINTKHVYSDMLIAYIVGYRSKRVPADTCSLWASTCTCKLRKRQTYRRSDRRSDSNRLRSCLIHSRPQWPAQIYDKRTDLHEVNIFQFSVLCLSVLILPCIRQLGLLARSMYAAAHEVKFSPKRLSLFFILMNIQRL